MGKAVIVKALIVVATAVIAAMTLPLRAAQVGPAYSIEMSRMISMRDGVQLEAWIFKPANLQVRAPAVLELTQYDIDGA
jgi:predicted acyl esterase